jgi:hypothetical protein
VESGIQTFVIVFVQPAIILKELVVCIQQQLCRLVLMLIIPLGQLARQVIRKPEVFYQLLIVREAYQHLNRVHIQQPYQPVPMPIILLGLVARQTIQKLELFYIMLIVQEV